jgi:signal transduction histidine kinase
MGIQLIKHFSKCAGYSGLLIIILISFLPVISSAQQAGGVHKDSIRVAALNKKFDELLENKQYEAASAVNDSLFLICKSGNDSKLLGDAYFNYALIENGKGNREQFITELKRAASHYKQVNEFKLAGKCYFLIGQAFTQLKDEITSLDYFKESLSMREKAGDSAGIANSLINVASLTYKIGDYSSASDYFFSTLKFAEKLRNDKLRALCLSNLSNLSNKMNNYGQSLRYLTEALELQQKLGNRPAESNIYSNFGNTYTEMKNYEKAKEYNLKALAIRKELNDEKGVGAIYSNLGIIARNENDTALSRYYSVKALNIAKKLGDKELEANALSNFALLSSMGDQRETEKLLLSSLEKSKELGNPILIMANYKNLKDYYEKKGDDSKALDYATLYQSLNDSTFRTENSDKILELQTKYETAEKEKQVAVLTREKLEKDIKLQKANQIRLILIGGITFLIILAGLIYSRYLIKKRSQAQLALINNQLKELNSTKDKLFSIVSHDLKNSVSAFTNITQVLNNGFEKMNQKDLKYYLGELSSSAGSMKQLFGNLLNWSKSQQNNIVVEPVIINVLNLIQDSIDPGRQKINSKKLVIRTECDEQLEFVSDVNIVNTVLRNLINNAVKFSPEEGEIVVKAWKSESEMCFTVTDKGIGMDADQIELLQNPANYIMSKPDTEGEKGAGLGLSLCRELLGKISGKMNIQSIKNDGSVFEIILPLSFQVS